MKQKTLYQQITDGAISEDEFQEIQKRIKARLAERVRIETTAQLAERTKHLGLCPNCLSKVLKNF